MKSRYILLFKFGHFSIFLYIWGEQFSLKMVITIDPSCVCMVKKPIETGAKIGNESMQFAIGMTKSLTRTPNQNRY